jgi:hypothetical protein
MTVLQITTLADGRWRFKCRLPQHSSPALTSESGSQRPHLVQRNHVLWLVHDVGNTGVNVSLQKGVVVCA